MAAPLNILQFGVTGQLAHELIDIFAGQSHMTLRALSRGQADFAHPQQVADAVASAGKFDVVINAAAYTAVDRAESEPQLAQAINAESVAALARACGKRNIPLIHISTDYVFDGANTGPYVETDRPNPLGVYGRTKLEGENMVRDATQRHVILRTSWVYSAHGSNFVKTMLRLGAERDELRVVDDQHGAPTSAADLAATIFAIVPNIVDGGGFGTFHYSDRGETTWRGFAEAIFAEASPWAHGKARIIPIPTAQYPTPARRPQNSRLDCSKIERIHGIVRPYWRDSLVRVLEEIKLRGAA